MDPSPVRKRSAEDNLIKGIHGLFLRACISWIPGKDSKMSDRILELFEEQNLRAVRDEILEMNYVDIEQMLEEMPRDKMLVIFRMLPKETAAEVFAEMESEQQQYIVESITDREINDIMDELYMDDTVDFI